MVLIIKKYNIIIFNMNSLTNLIYILYYIFYLESFILCNIIFIFSFSSLFNFKDFDILSIISCCAFIIDFNSNTSTDSFSLLKFLSTKNLDL